MLKYKAIKCKGANNMYYAGVDLGGTNIAVGIVDKNRCMAAHGTFAT